MAEVIEIIERLSLQVTGNEELQKQIDALKAQAKVIDDLTKKRDLLKRFVDKDTSPERAAKARVEIERLSKAIDRQTTALTKQVQQQQLVTRAATQELGIIQKLNDRISDLSRSRETQTTVAGIREINTELAALNEELKELTTPNAQGAITGGRGVFSQLLGISSGGGVGKQLLQGALAGAGIGAGFSVIPAITSSLIEYIETSSDVIGQVGKVQQANDALANSFRNLGEEVFKATEEFNKFFITQQSQIGKELSLQGTIEGAQRRIEEVNALGVKNGEIFEAEKKQLEARIALRNEELELIGKEQSSNEKILVTLTSATKAIEGKGEGFAGEVARSLGLGGVFDFIDKTAGNGEGVTITAIQRKAIDDALLGSNLPTDVTSRLRTAIKSAETDGATFFKVLSDLQVEYGAKSTELSQKLKDAQGALSNERVAFEAKNAAAIYELSRKLNIDIKQGEIQLAQEQNARREQTVETINGFYDQQGKLQTEALNREVELARKAGTLTAQIQAQFDTKFKQIIDSNEGKRLEAQRIFNLQQLQQAEQLNTELLQADLQAANQRLQLLTGTDLNARLALRNDVADKELEVQKAAISAQLDTELQARYKLQGEREKAGETETEAYAQTQRDILAIQEKATKQQEQADTANNAKRIGNIQEGYADVIQEVRKQTTLLLAQINEANAAAQADLSKIFTFNDGAFGLAFANRKQQLKNIVDTEQARIGQLNQELEKGNEALSAARKQQEKASTAEAKAAAKSAVTAAETTISQTNAAISTSNSALTNAQNENFKLIVENAISAYTTIANAAKSAYDQINEYRIQDLNREIAAREQRIDVALQLAEKGNTQLLDIEREALRRSLEERRKRVLQEQQLNAAMVVSNYALATSQSIVAITKTAATGGALAPVLIPAVITAIAGGIGATLAIVNAQRAAQTTGFHDGGYTGQGGEWESAGPVHKGEFVFNKTMTDKHRPVFEHMHKTGEIPLVRVPDYSAPDSGPTRREFNTLTAAVHGVRVAVEGQSFSAKNIVNENGVSQIVERKQRMDRNKYRS